MTQNIQTGDRHSFGRRFGLASTFVACLVFLQLLITFHSHELSSALDAPPADDVQCELCIAPSVFDSAARVPELAIGISQPAFYTATACDQLAETSCYSSRQTRAPPLSIDS